MSLFSFKAGALCRYEQSASVYIPLCIHLFFNTEWWDKSKCCGQGQINEWYKYFKEPHHTLLTKKVNSEFKNLEMVHALEKLISELLAEKENHGKKLW